MIVCEYADPTVPATIEAGETLIVGGFTVRVYDLLPVYGPVPVELSVAVAVKLKAPPAVGVPDSTPELLSVNPAGNAPVVTA